MLRRPWVVAVQPSGSQTPSSDGSGSSATGCGFVQARHYPQLVDHRERVRRLRLVGVQRIGTTYYIDSLNPVGRSGAWIAAGAWCGHPNWLTDQSVKGRGSTPTID